MAPSAPPGDLTLSIVTTLYRSSATLVEFHARCGAAAARIADRVEFILVNDGCPDDSLRVARTLMADDPRIVVLELARNFGHHKAMMTGLAHARGNLIFLIDCDLEEPPELLTRFHGEMTAGEWDVVYGVQSHRRGGVFERMTGAVFFSLVEALSDVPLPRNLITARLMSRAYVQALVAHRDRDMQISHLWALAGFRQKAVPVEKLSLSPTSYSLRRKIEMAVRHIVTTSTKILYFILYSGLFISAISLAYLVHSFFEYFLSGSGGSDYRLLIASLWFFGGVIISILGILGHYIAAILAEVKRRPYTHLRAIHRADANGPIADDRPLLPPDSPQ